MSSSTGPTPGASWLAKIGLWLTQITGVRQNERIPLLLGFVCFFCILCSYFLLRPIRDDLGIRIGPERIPELFRMTFLTVLIAVPVFGWLTKTFRRQIFMPAIFVFFIVNLFVFRWAIGNTSLDQIQVARAFFVWISSFNMFIVALFWSFMNDIFQRNQAQRLFGVIAAGGSAGAIAGPFITLTLIEKLGVTGLIPVSAVLLACALLSVLALFRWAAKQPDGKIAISSQAPIGGSIFAGIKLVLTDRYLGGILLLTLIATGVGTAFYIFQADVLANAMESSGDRTRVLATVDMAINTLTLLLQFVGARLAIAKFGVRNVLLVMPLITLLGLVLLTFAATVTAVLAIQIIRRATGFGLNNPCRETLFSIVSPDAKYKAKNFIDVSVVRGADVIASQGMVWLTAELVNFTPLALVGVFLCIAWTFVVFRLGHRYREAVNLREGLAQEVNVQ